MKVRVFWEGRVDGAKNYDGLGQHAAALKFAEAYERSDKRHGGTLQVEPMDDEARAKLSWESDSDGQFKLFDARPVVTWNVYAEHR
jgi:hypothetical protein